MLNQIKVMFGKAPDIKPILDLKFAREIKQV